VVFRGARRRGWGGGGGGFFFVSYCLVGAVDVGSCRLKVNIGGKKVEKVF